MTHCRPSLPSEAAVYSHTAIEMPSALLHSTFQAIYHFASSTPSRCWAHRKRQQGPRIVSCLFSHSHFINSWCHILARKRWTIMYRHSLSGAISTLRP